LEFYLYRLEDVMKKTFLISIVLFLFFLSFNLFAKEEEEQKPTTKVPEYYFSETEFDFGRMPPKSAVSHAYWVKNVGMDTLRILSVRPG